MEDKNYDNLKELIIRDLVKTQEDINKGISSSISLLKDLIIIEEGTGKIIIREPSLFKNSQKIILLLIGKYLANLTGITSQPEVSLKIIEEELNISRTTLSGPLGELVRQNILKKPGENLYKINPAKIEEEVKKLTSNGD
jgi:hypothetical protein